MSEEALERSLRVITEEYVALTHIMTEDEYILLTLVTVEWPLTRY